MLWRGNVKNTHSLGACTNSSTITHSSPASAEWALPQGAIQRQAREIKEAQVLWCHHLAELITAGRQKAHQQMLYKCLITLCYSQTKGVTPLWLNGTSLYFISNYNTVIFTNKTVKTWLVAPLFLCAYWEIFIDNGYTFRYEHTLRSV